MNRWMHKADRGRDGERGVTLVELLVVVTLLGVIGGIVTTGIVSGLSSASQTTAKIEALNELEIASQRVTRDLRAAHTILIAPDDPTRNITVLLAEDDGTLNAVNYEVNEDNELIRRETGQTLVTAVGNAADEPVFTYHDASGDELTDCDNKGCDGLAQVGLRLVRDVRDANPVITETRTSIRSVRYGSS